MEENTNVTTEVEVTKEVPAESTKTFTQEEFNKKLSEVLKDKEAKWEKKYSNYISQDDIKSQTEDLNNKIAELGNSLNVANEKASTDAQTIEALQTKVQNYETDSVKIRVALENGIPYELANKLSGVTEDEIREDAKKMSKYIGKTSAPLRNPEADSETDGVLAAFKALNPNLKF